MNGWWNREVNELLSGMETSLKIEASRNPRDEVFLNKKYRWILPLPSYKYLLSFLFKSPKRELKTNSLFLFSTTLSHFPGKAFASWRCPPSAHHRLHPPALPHLCWIIFQSCLSSAGSSLAKIHQKITKFLIIYFLFKLCKNLVFTFWIYWWIKLWFGDGNSPLLESLDLNLLETWTLHHLELLDLNFLEIRASAIHCAMAC